MKILRLMVVAVLLVFAGGVASAQQSKSDETLEFRPHWSIGVQGGAAYTLGEASFGKLISPAAALNFQWQFHHAFGLRLGLGGWQGKGAVVVPEYVYPFRYAQLSADVLMDLTSLIGGFNHRRVCSAYLFAGVGGAYGFDNKAAAEYKAQLANYWDKKFFVPGRFGLGVDFRLSDLITLGIEGNTNFYSDKFNSKFEESSPLDWQFGVLAGLKFTLGGNTRPSKVYAEKVAAAEAAAAAAAAAEAARLAAEKAEAERIAAEKAAAEKAEAERIAAEKAAAEKAAAERAALAAANSKDISFTIGSAYIRKSEDAKLVSLVEWLKANPDFSVVVVGYADKETGTSKGNLELSKKRANNVAARLRKLGLEENKLSVDFKGDAVQPFEVNDQNRVVVCTVK